MPNPFRGATQVWFELPTERHVTVRAFDVSGREIRTLADADFPAGGHALNWDGRDDRGAAVRGGVYFLKLASREGGASATALRLP